MKGKQRAVLRSMANTIDTILYIGKHGIVENTVRESDEALEARELIKGCEPRSPRRKPCRSCVRRPERSPSSSSDGAS